MAIGLKTWAGLAIAGCGLAAFALRPDPLAEDRGRFVSWPVERTRPSGAAALKSEIRAAHDRLSWLMLRDSTLSLLQAGDRPGTEGVVSFLPSQLPEGARARVGSVVSTAAELLRDVGEEMRVAIVVAVDTVPRVGGVPLSPDVRLVHMLPRVAEDSTCIALIHVRSVRRLNSGYYIDFLTDPASIAGPCGFYRAFGPPGDAVGRWLAANGYRFALTAAWMSAEEAGAGRRTLQIQAWIVSYAPALVSCAAGQLRRCRDGIFWEDGRADPPDRYFASARGRDHPFRDFAHRYLSDMAREMGPDRFARFWRTRDDMSAAFQAEMGESLESWTRDWAAARLGPVRRPLPSAAGLAIGGLLAVSAVGACALWSRRRQVG